MERPSLERGSISKSGAVRRVSRFRAPSRRRGWPACDELAARGGTGDFASMGEMGSCRIERFGSGEERGFGVAGEQNTQ